MALVKAGSRAERTGNDRKEVRDRAGLIAQLGDPAPDVRRWAAGDLAAHADAAPLLCERLAAETDPGVTGALLTSLVLIGTEDAFRGLLPLLRSDDAALRNAAFEALQLMPEAGTAHIRTLLGDPDRDIRIYAVNLVATLRQSAAESLLEVLRQDDDPNVCAAAVEALARIGTADMVPALRALLDRFPDQPFLDFAVRIAIRQLALPAAHSLGK